MPSYEYECQNCHAHVELVQSVENHQPPAKCPFCSMQHTMVRMFNQQVNTSEAEVVESEETDKE